MLLDPTIIYGYTPRASRLISFEQPFIHSFTSFPNFSWGYSDEAPVVESTTVLAVKKASGGRFNLFCEVIQFL